MNKNNTNFFSRWSDVLVDEVMKEVGIESEVWKS